MSPPGKRPITVALVDDYDIVVMGVANMFDNYRDRILVAELDATTGVSDTVDIVLTTRSRNRNPTTTRSASWWPTRAPTESWCTRGTFTPTSSPARKAHGAHGYLSKTLPARELVAALEAVHAGELVVSEPPTAGAQRRRPWTGPAAARDSATGSRRSWPSSPRARAMPRWRR